MCAYTLGMRQSELLGLDWDEVDLEAGTLRISRVLERGKGIRFGRPKSERVRRTLSLPGVTLDALKSHRVSQLEERLAAGGEWPDTGLVFTTPIAVLPWTIETSPRRSSTTWRASDCRNRGSTMPGTLAQRSSCPKECRSLRTIAMPNAVAACLREHRSRQLEERLQAGMRKASKFRESPRNFPIQINRHPSLEEGTAGGVTARDDLPAPSTRCGLSHGCAGRTCAHMHGSPGAFSDLNDHGDLRSRRTRTPTRSSGQDGRRICLGRCIARSCINERSCGQLSSKLSSKPVNAVAKAP